MSGAFDTIFKDARLVRLLAGEALFHVGDACSQMFIVINGRVALLRYAANGARLNLHTATAGQIVAEASAYSSAYHCAGVAEDDTLLGALPKEAFLARLDADPALANAWAASLAHGLQQARFRAEIRGLRTVSDRLDAWLADGGRVPPLGERQRLADTLGVTREALYRELSRRR